MPSFGEGFQQPQPTNGEAAASSSAVTANPATLTGGTISLRHKRHKSERHGGDRTHHSNVDETHGFSKEEDSRSVRASLFTEEDGGFGAVVPLDRYYGPTEIPALHLRVSHCRLIFRTHGNFNEFGAGHRNNFIIIVHVRLAGRVISTLLLK